MAAGVGKSSLLYEELLCAICLELYKNPILLPCLHSFCKECLEDLPKKTSKSNSPQDDDGNPWKLHQNKTAEVSTRNDSKKQLLECPNCRKMFEMKNGLGVEIFPPNFLLLSIVEKYKESLEVEGEKRQALKSKFQCDICGSELVAEQATTCRQCEILYCATCIKQCHPMKGVFSKHVLVPSMVAKIDTDINCYQHGEKMKVYCKDCDIPICYICDRVGGHQYHHAEDIMLAHHERLTEMQNLGVRLVELEDDIQREIKILQEHTMHMKAKEQGKIDEIHNMYSELHDILECRRAEMLSEVQAWTQEGVEVCDASLSKLLEDVDKIRGVQKVLEEATQEKRSAVFLMSQKSFRQRAMDMLLQCSSVKGSVLPTSVEEWRLQYEEAKSGLKSISVEKETVVSSINITGHEPLLVSDSVTISWLGVDDAEEYSIHLLGQLAESQEEITIGKVKHCTEYNTQKYMLHGLDRYSVCSLTIKCKTSCGQILKSSEAKHLIIFPPIKYEDFYFDSACSQNVNIWTNGKVLEGGDMVEQTCGAYTVYPLSQENATYFEVEIKLSLPVFRKPGTFVAVGLSESKFKNDIYDIPKWMVSFSLGGPVNDPCFQHCCVVNESGKYKMENLLTLDMEQDQSDIIIHYGFLLDNKTQTLTILDVIKKQFIHCFDVCLTNPIYPVFLKFVSDLKFQASFCQQNFLNNETVSDELQAGMMNHLRNRFTQWTK